MGTHRGLRERRGKSAARPSVDDAVPRPEWLRERLDRIRGPESEPPDVTVVVPVNAQADLDTVRLLAGDLAWYRGSHRFDIVVLVNNYPADQPPALEPLHASGIRTIEVPNVRKEGESPPFAARMLALQRIGTPLAVAFDADCRVVDATALVDHYVDVLGDRGSTQGAVVAYTPVAYFDHDRALSVQARIAAHHGARWVKRTLLRLPTTRGSNYAVRVAPVVNLYERGLLADDMSVGPTVRRHGGKVVYRRGRRLTVLTSGRVFRPGWRRLGRYLGRRLVYNARVLPGGANVHEWTRTVERSYAGRGGESSEPDGDDRK